MSETEEPEFEVESIVASRTEAPSRGKKSKLVWKYRVRWKGYSVDEDTWEPVESFVGSEEMVQNFWERVNTDGRDIQNLSLFNVGEEFCPIGPPRRKLKRKSTNATGSTTAPTDIPPENGSSKPKSSAKTSGKRPHESPDIIEISDRPVKRPRESKAQPPSTPQQSVGLSTRSKATPLSASAPPISSSKSKTRRRIPSPEVIPDSDEEANGPSIVHMDYLSPDKLRQESRSDKARGPSERRPSPIVIEDDDPLPAGSVDLDIERLFEEETIPAHRARLANPRVKMVDDPNLVNIPGAIATKTRAVERIAVEPSSNNPQSSSSRQPRRSKPGPGRSSAGHITILTGDKKGGLKSVKTKSTARNMSAPKVPPIPDQGPDDTRVIDVDNVVDNIPPSGDELLQLAGLDVEAAEALPDFEDHVPVDNSAAPGLVPDLPIDPVQPSSRDKSLIAAKDSLFPVQTSPPSSLSTTWSRPTIFGPLARGSEIMASTNQPTNASPLFLNLDISLAIPTFVTGIPQAAINPFIQKLGNDTAPGKFYPTNAALTLLGTVRATGAFAIVALLEDATSDNKDNFSIFHDRLKAGDIFVASAGTHIFIFCSSSNTLLSSRLNAPPALLNQPDKVLVSQVVVENYSGYADAAVNADDRRWSQYIATKN